MWKGFLGFFKKNLVLCILEIITFISILVTGIIFKQSALRIIPLCISLLVMLLQANVNRYTFLLGGLNAVLYAIAYFTMGLYSQAIYSLVFSFPLQIISFINWNRKKDGSSTKLLKMPVGYKILTFLGTAVVWAGLCLVYIFIVKENYLATTNFIIRLLDNVATITGVVATILMMLRFVEYVPLQITGLFSGLAIYSIMLPSEPAQITYIIYSVYSSICAFIAIHNMRKRYRKQQEDLAKTTNE